MMIAAVGAIVDTPTEVRHDEVIKIDRLCDGSHIATHLILQRQENLGAGKWDIEFGEETGVGTFFKECASEDDEITLRDVGDVFLQTVLATKFGDLFVAPSSNVDANTATSLDPELTRVRELKISIDLSNVGNVSVDLPAYMFTRPRAAGQTIFVGTLKLYDLLK